MGKSLYCQSNFVSVTAVDMLTSVVQMFCYTEQDIIQTGWYEISHIVHNFSDHLLYLPFPPYLHRIVISPLSPLKHVYVCDYNISLSFTWVFVYSTLAN